MESQHRHLSVAVRKVFNASLLQDIAAAVGKIEPEKSSKVQEAQSFLVSNPTCASAPQLHSKVDEANKKYDKVEQLLQFSQEKYVFILCGSWLFKFLKFFVEQQNTFFLVNLQL